MAAMQTQAKLNKDNGEHKQRVVMYVTLNGIRIMDEKTQVSLPNNMKYHLFFQNIQDGVLWRLQSCSHHTSALQCTGRVKKYSMTTILPSLAALQNHIELREPNDLQITASK